MSLEALPDEQWRRYMPGIEHQRQELRLIESAWDHLSLLSSLSLLSTKASSGGDLARAREDFAALSAELLRGLETEAVRNRLDDLGARAQTCIDVLVRNLFERTADIGFFATDVGVASFLAALPETRDRAVMEQRLREYASKYTVYDSICLFDTEGQLCASLDGGRDEDDRADGATSPRDLRFLRQVMQSNAPYIEDHAVHDFTGHGEPTLCYARRVEVKSRVVGVLCLGFKMSDEMPAIFHAIQGAEQNGAVLALADGQGRVLASSDTLQLPRGWVLPQAASARTAGVHVLHHASRRYLAVVRDAHEFQGYAGPPGWRGVALLPLDIAFDQVAAHEERSALMEEVAGNADFLSEELRDIPKRSVAIQSALERSVWNGLLELNQMDADEMTRRDLVFAKTLLSEIGVTARKTARVFSGALEDLYGGVMRSTLSDAASRAQLAMQILDRNLYERANDCRWWALTPQFAETLGAGREGCKQATVVLQDINRLYTVYACLVLFDREGRVLAVSNPAQADKVGAMLNEPWMQRCLGLSSTQDYVVSDYEPSRFYDGGPTFVYAAAVRDPDAGQTKAAVLGGIAIVWDAAAQLQSILGDCADGCGAHDALVFIDANDRVLCGSGKSDVLHSSETVESCRTGGRMVNLGGHLYGVGVARGAGYREFRSRDGYDHGFSCLALRHLCERRSANAFTVPQTRQSARFDAAHRVQMASFMMGAHWLGIEAAQVVAAAPDATARGAGVRLPFLGLAQVGERVYPLLDLRSIIVGSESVQREADPNRQIVVVRMLLEGGMLREFALRVDALGPMLEVDRRQFQAVPNQSGESLIDAVIPVPTNQGTNLLCRVAHAWLQQAARGAAPEEPQDLEALLAGA